jgi:CRP-like cAMP-binding protein
MAKSTKSPSSANRLLASLRPADFELLRPHIKTVELLHETVLYETGDTVDRVYFPYSGIISLVVGLAGGQMIEAAMVGRDSMLGGSSALDGLISLNKAIVQLPGEAASLNVARFRAVADKSPAFRTTLVRHEQALFAQVQQSTACNASHTLEARMSRWLLWARDLSGSDTRPLTQEFLGRMLGVQRSSVSLVANTLQHAGLISYSRGRIEIVDLDGLREASCECYEMIKAHYDRLLNNAS